MSSDKITTDLLFKELEQSRGPEWKSALQKILLAAVSSIPAGQLLATLSEIYRDQKESQSDSIEQQIIKSLRDKTELLYSSLQQIEKRFENYGNEILERIQSEEYLTLVRTSFKAWDRAETQEKRDYIVKLLSNAASATIVEDAIVRLFIEWLDKYHEIHFLVIKEIFRTPSCTRGQIWLRIHGGKVREDSAEADLFKLIIRDLSMGEVIRQERKKDARGNFMRKPPKRTSSSAPKVMKSAFEGTEKYELTALGRQFVHYVLSEAVQRLESDGEEAEEM